MSWRDGMRFRKFYQEHYAIPSDPFQQEIFAFKLEHTDFTEHLRKAYEAGYEDGFREGRTYDPLWDSD